MAYLFSKVTVNGGGYNFDFLTGGIPRDSEDLFNCQDFEDFLELITRDEEISIHVDAYVYGEGESCVASEPEVKSFEELLNKRKNFLETDCKNTDSFDFSFEYSPDVSEFDRFPFNRYSM